jgi:hypothetical protein
MPSYTGDFIVSAHSLGLGSLLIHKVFDLSAQLLHGDR